MSRFTRAFLIYGSTRVAWLPHAVQCRHQQWWIRRLQNERNNAKQSKVCISSMVASTTWRCSVCFEDAEFTTAGGDIARRAQVKPSLLSRKSRRRVRNGTYRSIYISEYTEKQWSSKGFPGATELQQHGWTKSWRNWPGHIWSSSGKSPECSFGTIGDELVQVIHLRVELFYP